MCILRYDSGDTWRQCDLFRDGGAVEARIQEKREGSDLSSPGLAASSTYKDKLMRLHKLHRDS